MIVRVTMEEPAQNKQLEGIEAVFIDFGDTLVATEPLYIERLRISFEKAGVSRSYPEIEKAYLEADWRSASVLISKTPFPQESWRNLFAAVMAEILNIKSNVAEVMKRVSDEMALIKPLRKLVSGAENFLDFCKSKGIRLILLTNNDGHIYEKCKEVKIENYFDFMLDSTLEGLIKPNPALFARALQKTGLHADAVVHIGDLLGCDVLGAQQAGIKAIWFHTREYTPRQSLIKPFEQVNNFEKLTEMLKV